MRSLALGLGLGLVGCQASPPPSQFPSAADALARMHDTYACSRGIQGESKIEYFGERGRVRGSVLYLAALPESLRFDVYSPFGVTLSTLTSDGREFALYDLKEKQFLRGPANACNVARFTQVPVPPFALAELLRGEAPVLVHEPAAATIAWEGEYVIRITSTRSATEEIHLEPTPADFALPWQQQRVRVTEVRVAQHGLDLYRAYLADHEAAATAAPQKDSDDPTALVLPPSGPPCNAEVPRRLRMVTPDTDQELVFHVKEASHNPPLSPGVFRQEVPRGVTVRFAACAD